MPFKRPVVLLVALLLGVAAVVFALVNLDGAADKAHTLDTSTLSGRFTAMTTSLGVTLALPHVVCSGVATLFCALAWGLRLRWAAITAGVLYLIAMVLMPPWFYLVFVQMVLCFTGAGILGVQKVELLIARRLKEHLGA